MEMNSQVNLEFPNGQNDNGMAAEPTGSPIQTRQIQSSKNNVEGLIVKGECPDGLEPSTSEALDFKQQINVNEAAIKYCLNYEFETPEIEDGTSDSQVIEVVDRNFQGSPGHLPVGQVSSADVQYACCDCQFQFPTKALLQKHVTTDICEGLRCQYCRCKFSTKRQLFNHVWHSCPESGIEGAKVSQEPKQRIEKKIPFTCRICGKSYLCTRKQGMVKHIKTHLDTRPFSCEYCGKTFKDERSCLLHTNRKHTESGEPVPCPICGKCIKPQSMRMHLFGHLPTVKSFVCDLCGKTFRLKGSLAAHTVTHQPKPEVAVKPFMCDSCGMTFSRARGLANHKVVHSDGKPFSCDICHNTFRRVESMTHHKQSVHSEVKRCFCDICGRPFAARGYRNRHAETHFNASEKAERGLNTPEKRRLHNIRRREMKIRNAGKSGRSSSSQGGS